MYEYIATWELMSAQLALMDAFIDECLRETIFVEIFGARLVPRFSAAILALLVQYELTSESVTARLLQEDILSLISKSPICLAKDLALVSDYQESNKIKKKFDDNGEHCWYCGKLGRTKANCFERKWDMTQIYASRGSPDKATLDW